MFKPIWYIPGYAAFNTYTLNVYVAQGYKDKNTNKVYNGNKG